MTEETPEVTYICSSCDNPITEENSQGKYFLVGWYDKRDSNGKPNPTTVVLEVNNPNLACEQNNKESCLHKYIEGSDHKQYRFQVDPFRQEVVSFGELETVLQQELARGHMIPAISTKYSPKTADAIAQYQKEAA